MVLGTLKKSTHPASLYETDFFRWTEEQGRALRERRPSEIDWENVAEEIETLGRSDKRSIESNLTVLVLHLLTWEYQSNHRKSGWKSSIAEHRARIRKLTDESPSLRNYPGAVLEEEYRLARLKAADETDLPLDTFPADSPYTIAEILDETFFPGGEH